MLDVARRNYVWEAQRELQRFESYVEKHRRTFSRKFINIKHFKHLLLAVKNLKKYDEITGDRIEWEIFDLAKKFYKGNSLGPTRLLNVYMALENFDEGFKPALV